MKTRAEWVLPLYVPSLPSVSGVWGVSLPMFDYFTVFHFLCHYSSCNFGVWTPCYLDKRRVLRPSYEFPIGSIGDLHVPFLGKFRINGGWDLKLTHRPSLVDHGWIWLVRQTPQYRSEVSFQSIKRLFRLRVFGCIWRIINTQHSSNNHCS